MTSKFKIYSTCERGCDGRKSNVENNTTLQFSEVLIARVKSDTFAVDEISRNFILGQDSYTISVFDIGTSFSSNDLEYVFVIM
jgi:hypothetical protein